LSKKGLEGWGSAIHPYLFRFRSMRHVSAAKIFQVTGDIEAVRQILSYARFENSNVFTYQFKAIEEKMNLLRNLSDYLAFYRSLQMSLKLRLVKRLLEI
jgi:hypothetical protein